MNSAEITIGRGRERPTHVLSGRWFVVIWFGLVAIFVGSHFTFYFLQPHVELGDYAANALQIHNAKYFDELHGHYSRWGFHHPGPGFFYFYAMGEWILRDLLRIVPSPFNAHAISGIILQTGFFTWTLAIVQRQVRYRLIVPVLLVLAALHFGAVNYNVRDSAFSNIWPVHALVFPFLCLLVASAALANGSSRAILPAVMAGCFLAHGHVAQSMFVLPIFTTAAIVAAYRSRVRHGSVFAIVREAPRQGVAAALVLVVFLLPLLIDAAQGPKSNLHAILGHFGRTQGDDKTLLQSLTYLTSFFAYMSAPEQFAHAADFSSLQALATRWGFLALWAVLICLAVAVWWHMSKRINYLWWLGLFCAGAFALTIWWGMMQTGALYNFNSHFNFGLLFVPLIFVAAGMCELIRDRYVNVVAAAASLLAIALFLGTARSWHFDRQLVDLNANLTVVPGLAEAAKADGHKTKYLAFRHGDWGWATSIAVELRRMGFKFAVPKELGFMFGKERVRDIGRAIAKDQMPVWRTGPEESGLSGFRVPGFPFVITSPAVMDPAGAEIRFHGPTVNAHRYALYGWDVSDGPFSWSDSPSAALYFSRTPAAGAVTVTIEAAPSISAERPSRRMRVAFNSTEVGDFTQTQGERLVVRIPAELWNANERAVLSFRFPDAASPAELGHSEDRRQIAFAFTSIRFAVAAPP